ncbi:hypothetical protein HDU91_002150, partial [Kappamyces sp. JEL0680]
DAKEFDPDYAEYLSKYEMDRKTLLRSLESLRDDKRIRMESVVFRTATGGSVTKLILAVPSVSRQDPRFREFVDTVQSLHLFGFPKPRAVEKNTDLEVDRVQRTSLKREAGPSIFNGEQDPDAIDIGVDLNFDSAAAPAAGQANDKTTGAVVHQSKPATEVDKLRTKYGYKTPKFLRAQKIHHWIYTLTEPGSGEEAPTHIYSVARAFSELPLKVYMEVCGPSQETAYLQQLFADQAAYGSITLGMIPEAERIQITNMQHLKRGLFLALNTLELLQVVQPLKYVDSGRFEELPLLDVRSIMPSHYRVLRQLPFFDFGVDPALCVETLPCPSSSHLERYWSRLRYQYFESISPPAVAKRYAGVTLRRNWVSSMDLDADQKRGLLSQIHRGETPLENTALCQSLADLYDLSLDVVKKFYTNYQSTKLRRMEQSRKRVIKGVKSYSRRKPRRRVADYFVEERFLETDAQDQESSEDGGSSSETDALSVEGSARKTRNTRRRIVWKEEDNQLLVYGYAILCNFLKYGKPQMKLGVQLLPHLRLDAEQ